VNFPEQEYKDVFGGTLDNALMAEYEDHKIQLFKGESTAMINHQADARKASLRASKEEIDGLNKKEEWINWEVNYSVYWTGNFLYYILIN